jgi:hypothetical protein
MDSLERKRISLRLLEGRSPRRYGAYPDWSPYETERSPGANVGAERLRGAARKPRT